MASGTAADFVELVNLWGRTEEACSRSLPEAASVTMDDKADAVVEENIVPLVARADQECGRRRDNGSRRSDVRHRADRDSSAAGGGLMPQPQVIDERPVHGRGFGLDGRRTDYDPVALNIRALLNSDDEQQPKATTRWQLVRSRLLPSASSSKPKVLHVWSQAMAFSAAVTAIDDDNKAALIETLEVLEKQRQKQKPSSVHSSGDRDRGYQRELAAAAMADLSALLQHAIASGRSRSVDALLQIGGDTLVLCTRSFDPLKMTTKTCLHDAVLRGDVAIVDSILRHLSPDAQAVWLRHETAFVDDRQGSFGGDRLSATALHLAALCGHVALVEYLVRVMSVPVDMPCSSTKATPLLFAAKRNHAAVVRSLLALGARTDLVDDAQRTLLHYGILSGDKDTMAICLQASQRPVCIDQWKQANPLLLAIYIGNVDMLIALLDDPDVRGLVAVPSVHLGQTPLHAACGQEDGSAVPMCKALLRCGADAAAVNKHGETPLMTAAYRNSSSTIVAMARHFCAPRKRYFAIANASGHSVWHYAMQPDRRDALIALLEAALHAQRLECVGDGRESDSGDASAATRDQGETPDLGAFLALEVDGVVTTPLHLAVKWGADGCLALLLKYISPFTTDGNGDTFLHLAAVQGCESVLKEFVFDSSTANLINFQGHSLLHAACRAGSWACARILLPLADPWTPSVLGETVAHELCHRDDLDYGLLRDVLLARRCSSGGDGGSPATGEEKLALRDAYGRTALHHLAARNLHGCADKYFRLFETTGDAGKRSPCNVANNVGDTPLHDCLLAGRVDNLAALLAVFGSNADVNVSNTNGLTPLHLAAKLELVDAIKPLLSNGAKLGIYDADGNTVVHAIIRQAAEQPSRADCCRAMLEDLLHHARDENLPLPRHRVAAPWPSETSSNRLRSVAITLLCQTKNSEGLSAIFYAAQVGSIELLQFILTMDDAFKLAALSTGDVLKDHAFYDVTDLVPETVSCKEGNYVVSNKKEQSQHLVLLKGLCGYHCLTKKNIQPTCETSQCAFDERSSTTAQPHRDSPPASSVVEVILLNTSTSGRILELTPIKEMVADYWSPYKFMFLALMAIHVVSMSYFSWVSLDAVGNVRPVLNCSAPFDEVSSNVSSGHVLAGHEAHLAVGMLWPLLILVGDVAWLVNYACKKSGCRLADAARKKVTDDATHSHVPMFWLVGIAFSWLSICFYVLHMINHCAQDYALCAALISGWIYTIHFTQGIRSVHHFAVALSKILTRDIWQFGIVCGSVLLGYSCGMHALTIAVPQQAEVYESYDSTLFTVFSWGNAMAGFFPETRQDYSEAGKNIKFIQGVFVTFIIAINIIMLNMLIAVMNDSYAAVRERSDVAWRLSWLRKAISLEKQRPSIAKVVRRWRRKDIVTDPAWPGRYYMKVPLSPNVEVDREAGQPDLETVTERLAAIETAVNSLSAVVGELASKSGDDCDSSLADDDQLPTEEAARRVVRLGTNCDAQLMLSAAFARPLSRRSAATGQHKAAHRFEQTRENRLSVTFAPV